MLGVFFSGTGNTEYCVRLLSSLLDESYEIVSLENPSSIKKIEERDTIIFGYPIQYSNIPYFVREFIIKNSFLWKNKKIICLATMGAFSGDGAGCSARLFKKYGAIILGGLHIKMPDSVCDSPLLKKNTQEKEIIIKNATKKIKLIANNIKNKIYPNDGLSSISHIIGLLGQRLWFFHKTKTYSNNLTINENCIGCGLCSKICPTQNISIVNLKAIGGNKCTLCYRCVSNCPQKAITILGKKVIEQYKLDNYI